MNGIKNKFQKEEIEVIKADPLWAFSHFFNVPKHPALDNTKYYPIHESTKRYIVLQGGRGSAKSYEMGRAIVIKMCLQPEFRGVVIRQVRATVKHSMWSVVKAYITYWELNQYFDVKEQEIRHLQTGALLTMGGMDKPDSFKSINNLTHAFFEEAYSITTTRGERTQHEGIETIDKSVRSQSFQFPKQLWFAYNPYNKDHWLHEWFFDTDGDKPEKYRHYRENSLVLITNFTDNQHLDQQSISRIMADQQSKPDVFRVDGMGLWGSVKIKGLYYKYFESANQVKTGLKSEVYDHTKPLHISFDFNVNPYNTLVVHQVHYDHSDHSLKVCVIDEICLRDKRIQETMKEFLNRYKGQQAHVYFYGDRSGHNRKTNAVTDYSTVMIALGLIQPQRADRRQQGKLHNDHDLAQLYHKLGCRFQAHDRTCRSNPSLLSRQIMLDRLCLGELSVLNSNRIRGHAGRPLSDQYGGTKIDLLIDASCRETIKDFQQLREDAVNGGKFKGDAERSHTSDALEYFLLTYFDAEHDDIVIEMKS